MTEPQKTGITVALCVVALVGLSALSAHHASAMANSLRAMRDSLLTARSAAHDVLEHTDTLWRERTVTIRRSDTVRIKGDSYVVLAHQTGADTASLCRPVQLALAARTSECALLRSTVQDDSAVLLALRHQVARDTTAMSALQHAIDAAKVVPPCRVLLFPCPSRTITFLAGAVTGVILDRKVP